MLDTLHQLHTLLDTVPPAAWLAALGVASLGWWLADTRTGRGNQHRAHVARQAEQDAERLLARAGYRVVDRQVPGGFTMTVDDDAYEVTCRADLLVRRWGRFYVAEVKSGPTVSDPTHPDTRRQLLEYQLAFDVHGVLLVDMHRATVSRVDLVGRRWPGACLRSEA